VEWSADLGSDITFFLSRGTAYCTGRGEIMTPVDPPLPAGTKLVIVKPNVGLSTPAVFKALNYDLLSSRDPQELLEAFRSKGVEGVDASCYINDLEPPAFQNLPELQNLKQELQQVQGFQHVMMSGSGTSIFCIGEPKDRKAFERDFGTRENLQIFFAEFINRPSEDVWFERPK
jgi:4-diphosphocytidyl-2-C-methyl-D-erythritol kinase